MKRVLVTGGTGFVGANLARRLLGDGHDVHLLVRPGYRGWRIDSIRDSIRLHVAELGDKAQLAGLVEAVQPEWVFHLAAYGAYSTQTNLDRMIQTNLIGTVNLVEACLRVGFDAFVNAGSSSEYGLKDHAAAEDEWVDPNSHYALTKVSATQFCRYTALAQGVHLITLRLYSAYGVYEEPTRLMPTLIVNGLDGGLPPLVNPDIARDYVYIDDVCDAFVLAASQPDPQPGAVYNLGTGIQTTLGEVVAVARDVMQIDAEPQWGTMPDRKWDTSVWVADPRRIKQALNWQPRFGFEAGFRAMVDWLRSDSQMRAFYQSYRTLPT
ncbi:MAG: NAD-dependent epimerase/dehydratase family protein [Anaerolineae bacterium]|nr:NAD-dependent epimerase/dehydratase family protein [Anaerolineae bacterium]